LQICGRHFSKSELDWIRNQVKTRPDLNRARLSRLFCHYIDWRKPDGGLKEMSCRVAMLRLERSGLIRLPAPRTTPVPVGKIKRTPQGDPKSLIELNAGRVNLAIEPVERNTAPLWNELIDRYHYLGYRRHGGAQMRFFVYAENHLVALLGFSAAAWRVAPRDDFIGWTALQRKQNLHLVIDNSRFLILPWVKSKNLASRILSHAARKLPLLWQQRYHYGPSLVETFVEKYRFEATCYKAANWICVGQTLGRGKWDRTNAYDKPVKTIWLYPLDRHFKERLCR
jgi:hypothetical protein